MLEGDNSELTVSLSPLALPSVESRTCQLDTLSDRVSSRCPHGGCLRRHVFPNRDFPRVSSRSPLGAEVASSASEPNASITVQDIPPRASGCPSLAPVAAGAPFQTARSGGNGASEEPPPCPRLPWPARARAACRGRQPLGFSHLRLMRGRARLAAGLSYSRN